MISVSEIEKILLSKNMDCQIVGNTETEIDGFSSIYMYRPGTLTWLRNFKTLSGPDFSYSGDISVIITSKDCPTDASFITQIKVGEPRTAFFALADLLWGEKKTSSISPKAFIEDGAIIGKDVSIGHFSAISGMAKIGAHTIIGANVTIKGRVEIGENCVIQSGAVIGEDGFAFINSEDELAHVKHYGGVKIHDHVSIGSNACICRGTIDDTEIFDYVKIDNLCHIAHNVRIGERTVVVAGSIVMGSVHVGSNSWISTSIIRDQRHVGRECTVGMGAVVTKDVADRVIVVGNPAKIYKELGNPAELFDK